MIDIIFRGKRIDNGEWVKGSLSHDKTPNNTYAFIDGEFKGVQRVEPETVGQFIGVLDKNGVKIFKGDIVRFVSSKVAGMKLVPGGVLIGRIDYDEYCHSHIIVGSREYHIEKAIQGEVIGNIHDNPELLTEAK